MCHTSTSSYCTENWIFQQATGRWTGHREPCLQSTNEILFNLFLSYFLSLLTNSKLQQHQQLAKWGFDQQVVGSLPIQPPPLGFSSQGSGGCNTETKGKGKGRVYSQEPINSLCSPDFTTKWRIQWVTLERVMLYLKAHPILFCLLYTKIEYQDYVATQPYYILW